MTKEEFEAAVDEMHASLMRQFPDPVDVFEDDLAKKLGFERDPTWSLEEWRSQRVRFINSVDGERDVLDLMEPEDWFVT